MSVVSSVPPDLRPKPEGAGKPAGNQVGGLNPGVRTQRRLARELPREHFRQGPVARRTRQAGVRLRLEPDQPDHRQSDRRGDAARAGRQRGDQGRLRRLRRSGSAGSATPCARTTPRPRTPRRPPAARSATTSARRARAKRRRSARRSAPAQPEGSALANAAAATSAGVGGLGKGIAGESASRGYTGLSELIGHGNAAQDLADAYPGLAKLEGLSTEHGFTDQVQGDLKGKTDSLLAQIPGMTAQEIQTLDVGRRLERATTRLRCSRRSSAARSTATRRPRSRRPASARTRTRPAIDWTSALGYKTDAKGNPVYDSNGNLIPTEKTVKDCVDGGREGLEGPRDGARRTSARRATPPPASCARSRRSSPRRASRPRSSRSRRRSRRSSASTRSRAAASRTTRPRPSRRRAASTCPPSRTQEIFKLAMAQPEVQVLASRYALKPAEIAKIVQQGLAAAGVNPPAAKPKRGEGADDPGRADVPGVARAARAVGPRVRDPGAGTPVFTPPRPSVSRRTGRRTRRRSPPISRTRTASRRRRPVKAEQVQAQQRQQRASRARRSEGAARRDGALEGEDAARPGSHRPLRRGAVRRRPAAPRARLLRSDDRRPSAASTRSRTPTAARTS
jgi:hypothetical protein